MNFRVCLFLILFFGFTASTKCKLINEKDIIKEQKTNETIK